MIRKIKDLSSLGEHVYDANSLKLYEKSAKIFKNFEASLINRIFQKKNSDIYSNMNEYRYFYFSFVDIHYVN